MELTRLRSDGVSGISTLLSQLKTFNTVLQQTIAKIVGTIKYDHTPGSEVVVKRLLDMVEPGVSRSLPSAIVPFLLATDTIASIRSPRTLSSTSKPVATRSRPSAPSSPVHPSAPTLVSLSPPSRTRLPSHFPDPPSCPSHPISPPHPYFRRPLPRSGRLHLRPTRRRRLLDPSRMLARCYVTRHQHPFRSGPSQVAERADVPWRGREGAQAGDGEDRWS